MSVHRRFVRGSISLGLFLAAAVISAQTGAKPSVATSTWLEYLSDLRPNLEQGRWATNIDPKFWDKYNGLAIEWAGTLKECKKFVELAVIGRYFKDSAVCDVTMPAQLVKVKTKSGVVPTELDQVHVIVEKSEAEKWEGLKAAAPVRFSARTLASVYVLEAGAHDIVEKRPNEKLRVDILLTEGRLLGSR